MNPANYVIFHPDRKREEREVSATTLVDGILKKNWVGNIWVDTNNSKAILFFIQLLFSKLSKSLHSKIFIKLGRSVENLE